MTQLTQEQALERAQKLVKLAAHSQTPAHEASVAAIKACKIIRKYKLLDNPLTPIVNHPAVQAAKTIFETVNDPAVRAAGQMISEAVKKARARR